MDGLRQRIQPYRDKHFAVWAHSYAMGYCCVPGCNNPWLELHHFGDDGGKSLKPSDHLQARMCLWCHKKYDIKMKALIRDGRHELLIAFFKDAAELWRGYMEYLKTRSQKGEKKNGK